jgi:hypothetical protein
MQRINHIWNNDTKSYLIFFNSGNTTNQLIMKLPN